MYTAYRIENLYVILRVDVVKIQNSYLELSLVVIKESNFW